MRNIINKKSKLLTTIVVLLLGYDVLTYIPDVIPPAVVKQIYFAFLFILYVAFLKHNNAINKLYLIKNDLNSTVTFIFIVLYLIRVVYDLYFMNVSHLTYKNEFTYVFLYCNTVLIPFLFLRVIDLSKIGFDKLYNALIIVTFIACVLSVIEIRSSGFDGNRFDANSALDTIAFGHLGVTLVLLAFSRLFTNRVALYTRLFLILIMLFGLFIAVLANSRGPFVALVVSILFFSIVKRHFIVAFFVFAALMLSTIYIDSIDSFFSAYGTGFIERISFTLSEFDDTDVTSGRSEIYELAISEFISNPMLGSSFLVQTAPFKGVYPHNVVIESFLALGIFGGLLFLFMIIKTFQNAVYLIKASSKYLFVSLLFVQYMSYATFSRSLINLPVFWLALFLVNNIQKGLAVSNFKRN